MTHNFPRIIALDFRKQEKCSLRTKLYLARRLFGLFRAVWRIYCTCCDISVSSGPLSSPMAQCRNVHQGRDCYCEKNKGDWCMYCCKHVELVGTLYSCKFHRTSGGCYRMTQLRFNITFLNLFPAFLRAQTSVTARCTVCRYSIVLPWKPW